MANLTNSDAAFYRRNGYFLARGLLTRKEARALRDEAHSLAERLRRHGAALDATWKSAVSSGRETQVLHCHDVQFYSAAFARLLVDERFTKAASLLMGSPNVQLHHTKMFIKPPEKGSPFPLHQDYPYFPHQRNTMMAAIFHFDDAPAEKGCLRVIPRSHKLGPLRHVAKGNWHLAPNKYPLESARELPARAGDVLFFSYLTIHGSGLNVSRKPRTTLLVQMRDPEDQPKTATHVSRGQGMMLRGIDPAASKPHNWGA